HRDSHAAEPPGSQGDRRVGDDRLDTGGPERRRRRALPPGRPPPRSPAVARTRPVGDPSRQGLREEGGATPRSGGWVGTGRRRGTDHPGGVVDGAPTLGGEGVVYWLDQTGDESGGWFVEPFAGGEPRPFLDGAPVGWNQRMAQAPGVVAAAISDRDGFGIWVSIDGGPAKELVRSTESLVIAGADWGGFNRGGLS